MNCCNLGGLLRLYETTCVMTETRTGNAGNGAGVTLVINVSSALLGALVYLEIDTMRSQARASIRLTYSSMSSIVAYTFLELIATSVSNSSVQMSLLLDWGTVISSIS